MKNYADLGKWYLLRPKAEADNSIQEVHNSSYYTKAEFNIVFFIHSKYFQCALTATLYVKFPSSKHLFVADKEMFILQILFV